MPWMPTHRHPNHLNQPPCPLSITPCPSCWCEQCQKVFPCPGSIICWCLAPTMTLPGHGSMLMCLSHQHHAHSMSPYAMPSTPTLRMCKKCQNMQKCRNHICGSCLLQAPIATGWHQTNRGGFNAPSAIRTLQRTVKTMPVSPGSTLAFTGDIGGDWAQICAWSRSCPHPGSPLKLPGVFSSCWVECKEGKQWCCMPFLVHAALGSILCTL